MSESTKRATESCISGVFGNVHIVRWLRAPALEDVQTVTREVERTAASLGRTLVCIAIIPGDVEPPSDDARKRMLGDLDRLVAVSESIHFVIEGSGFKHVMLRSVVTGLILVAGRRGRIFVHSTLDEALREAGSGLTLAAGEIRHAARAKGLVAE
jgi:hypothetical protein